MTQQQAIEFLTARIAEDEAVEASKYRPRDDAFGGEWRRVTWQGTDRVVIEDADGGAVEVLSKAEYRERYMEPAPDPRRLAECAAKRAIIKQHEDWPVLVEKRVPSVEPMPTDVVGDVVFRVTQELAWLTEREYVERFGLQPPTAPMIRTLAAIYKDHPDYREEWA